MEKLNLSLCEYSDKISLDAEGNLDDSKNGEFGYKVFYEVPKSEIDRLEAFKDLDEFKELEEGEDYCGELEFSVDENGEQCGEVLLWFSIEVEDEESTENVDFVNYENDISELVDDFNNRQMKKGDR